MIYSILIMQLLIKYVNLDYSFNNVKVLMKKKLSKNFSGYIFPEQDSFYLNKINKAIIENNKNIIFRRKYFRDFIFESGFNNI